MLKSFRQRRLRRVRGQARTPTSCEKKESDSQGKFEHTFNRKQNHWTLGDSELEDSDMPAVAQILEGMRDSDNSLINRKLPRELLLKIFSFLDIVTLCRCAQVSKTWNQLALDGSNWQSVDLFSFQTDVESKVIENLSKRCGGFLKNLSLKGCMNIDDRTLQIFSQHCQNLSKLVLDKCTQISDKTLLSLSENCPLLKALHTSSCHHVSDTGLKFLGDRCHKLEVLDIAWCDEVTDEGVGHIARNCPNLKELILVGVTEISDATLETLSQHCRDLRVLNVQKCSAITDDGIHLICQGCSELVSVNFSDIPNLRDYSLRSLSQHCAKLQTLQVAHCSQLSDDGFVTLAQKCKELRRMDLEDCILVSNITLRTLARHCPHLSELTLSHCELITDDGIRELGLGDCATENLRIIELDNCPLITDLSLDNLVTCQNLERIELYDCQLITRGGIKRLKNHLKNVDVKIYFTPPTPASVPEPLLEVPPEWPGNCCCCRVS